MVKKQIIQILKDGGIGVLPTDTMYGIVGSALKPKTVAKIYRLRKRNLHKPMIVLIGSFLDLLKLGIKLTPSQRKTLKQIWPAPVSVILPCRQKKFNYLTRGTKTLAVRISRIKPLIRLLSETGPLVAPSANWEGQPPAKTIKEARKYFNNKIAFYINGGTKNIVPSTIIKFNKNKIEIIRSGAGLKKLKIRLP